MTGHGFASTAPLFLFNGEVVTARKEPEGFVTNDGAEGQPGDWWVEADDGTEWAVPERLIGHMYEPVNRPAVDAMNDAGIQPGKRHSLSVDVEPEGRP